MKFLFSLFVAGSSSATDASTLGKAWARRVIAPAALVRPSLQNLQRQGQQHLHVFVCLLPNIFELRTRGSEDLQVSRLTKSCTKS